MKTLYRWIARGFLYVSETMFLEAYGWKKTWTYGVEVWTPPDTYHWEKKKGIPHSHRHAVNSQKAACGNQKREKAFKEVFEE